MSTYTQIFYHIVFSTKDRVPALTPDHREQLFRYMHGIVQNRNSALYSVNGTADHVHLLAGLHPTIRLSDLVKEVKGGTSYWMKKTGLFPRFSHWQDGYGAFTHSTAEKDRLIEYIRRQENHHRKVSFVEELRKLLREAGVEFDEKRLGR